MATSQKFLNAGGQRHKVQGQSDDLFYVGRGANNTIIWFRETSEEGSRTVVWSSITGNQNTKGVFQELADTIEATQIEYPQLYPKKFAEAAKLLHSKIATGTYSDSGNGATGLNSGDGGGQNLNQNGNVSETNDSNLDNEAELPDQVQGENGTNTIQNNEENVIVLDKEA